MSAVPYDSHEQDWDPAEPETSMSPGRPRRRFFNRRTATLAALITCGAGFYAGIEVEKGQLSSTASAATTSAAPGAATGAATGTAPAGRIGAAGGPGAAGGFAGRFSGSGSGSGSGAAGAGAANGSFGTISSVNGKTIYLTDPTGNTVKVTLSSSTKLTKNLGVSTSSLHPGDSVAIQGVKNSNGTLVATSVSDSGTRATGGGSGSNSTTNGG
jgi:hypothetical protein